MGGKSGGHGHGKDSYGFGGCKEVVILPFFSRLYIDDEMKRLSREYEIEQYEMQSLTLGRCDAESFAANILGLARIAGRLVGVLKTDLEVFAGEFNLCWKRRWYIPELIRGGYLREGSVAGEPVLYPTEELVKNYGIPKREKVRSG